MTDLANPKPIGEGGVPYSEMSLYQFAGTDYGSKIPESGTLLPIPQFMEGVVKGMRKWPNTLGVVGAGVAIVEDLIKTIPFVRYLHPENQEKFMQLDKQHQVRALLWDTAEAEAWIIGGKLIEGAIAAEKWLWGRLGAKALSRMSFPYGKSKVAGSFADISKGLTERGDWIPYSYERELQKTLKKMRFGKDEIPAVMETVLDSESLAARNMILEKLGRKKKISKAFNENMDSISGTPWKISPSESMLKKVSYDKLQQKHAKRMYREALKGRGISADHMEKAFNFQIQRLFGPGEMKPTLGDLSDELASKLIQDMVSEPYSIRRFLKVGFGKGLAWIEPTRVIMGFGEKIFGTKTRIVDRFHLINGETKAAEVRGATILNTMLEEAGFGKLVMKGDIPIFHPGKKYSKEVMARTKGIQEQLDVLAGRARAALEAEEAVEHKALIAEIKGVFEGLGKEAPEVGKLLQVSMKQYDYLYGELLSAKLPRYFQEAQMTPLGIRAFFRMMDEEISPTISEYFSVHSLRPSVEKLSYVQNLFKRLNGLLESPEKEAWFGKAGPELDARLGQLKKRLTLGLLEGKKPVGFPNYLEAYSPRIPQRGSFLVQEWVNTLTSGKGTASFMKGRVLETPKVPLATWRDTMDARIRAHAKELYFYDQVGEVVKFASSLPGEWPAYTEHILARILNLPSQMDLRFASALESTVGRLERMAGREGTWDVHRLVKLAMTVQDLKYAGLLGMRPFAIARNLFQPLINVPADLGGIGSFWYLTRGLARLANPKAGPAFMSEMREIGLITGHLPDTFYKSLIAKPRKFVGKAPLPLMTELTDFCLWGFKASDAFNRYLTASAADLKWKAAWEYVGKKVTMQNLGMFLKRAGVKGRRPWVKDEISTHLAGGRIGKAREIFLKDVVADTQYLYTSVDSPVALHFGGIVWRDATAFQSWWMNYVSLLSKWVRNPETLTEKEVRAATWVVSTAMAFTAMSAMWEPQKAARAVGLGPLPVDILTVPPTWRPIVQTLKMAVDAGWGMPTGVKDVDDVKRDFVRLAESITVFVPGGLMAQQAARGFHREGFEGFLKELVGRTAKKTD